VAPSTARIARQKEIDASIAAKADSEYLYDKPYEDKSKVRVAGPFTVEILRPHRSVIVNDDDTITEWGKQFLATVPFLGSGFKFNLHQRIGRAIHRHCFLDRLTLYSCLYYETAKQAGRLLLQVSFSH
jgi:hypothetical protein